MGKDIGRIYKHSKYQLSTSSPKALVSLSSEQQISSVIELTTTSVPSATDKHKNNSVLYYQNTTQNDATITNNDDIQSCETSKKQNYIISTISTPNHYSQHIASPFSSRLDFNTPTILPLIGKEYMCFMKEGKSDQAARCIKSRIMTMLIDSVISIETSEQQYVVIKGIFQSLQLKYHVQTIGIYQSLSNNNLYEHKYLENIKKLYKQAGKCDDQQKFNNIIEAAMVSTPEGFTYNSTISPRTSTPVKKLSARKSLCMFTNVLDVKKNCLPLSWSC